MRSVSLVPRFRVVRLRMGLVVGRLASLFFNSLFVFPLEMSPVCKLCLI